MLTRKQLWRRQKKFISRNDQDYLYNHQGNDSESTTRVTRSISEPYIPLQLISNLGRIWSTTGDLKSKINEKKKKCVKFSKSVNVKLIPTRNEYQDAGLASDIWWENQDYSSFKDSAVSEIKNIMLVDDRIDCKAAQALLYQPSSGTHSIKSRLLEKPNAPHKIYDSSPKKAISFHLKSSPTKSLLSSSENSIRLTQVRSEVDLKHLADEVNEENVNHIMKSKSVKTQSEKMTPHRLSFNHHYLRTETPSENLSVPKAFLIENINIHPLAYICS